MPWRFFFDCPSCLETYWCETPDPFPCEVCDCTVELREPKIEETPLDRDTGDENG